MSASILSCPIYVLSPSNRWDGWGCPNICPICPIFLVVVAVRGFCRGVGGVTTYVSDQQYQRFLTYGRVAPVM